MSLLGDALELAEAGWEVFPLNGKLPIIPKAEGGSGFHDATADLDQVRAWWERWPAANIGLAVPRGMVVLDVDPRHGGEEALAALVARHGELPPTLTVITGSGGRHLWFAAFTDHLEQKPLGDGLDSRIGGKGYVLAPPSVHPRTGQVYQWVQPLARTARLPHWLAEPLRRRQRLGTPPRLHVIDGLEGMLSWAAERVAHAPEGRRHETLRNIAILLGGYVAAGQLSESAARSALLDACSGWPARRKSEGTIEDGLRHGQGRPLVAS